MWPLKKLILAAAEEVIRCCLSRLKTLVLVKKIVPHPSENEFSTKFRNNNFPLPSFSSLWSLLVLIVTYNAQILALK